MHTIRQPDFTDQPIYVGIDVHKKSWAVSINTGDFEHKTFTQPSDPKILVSHLNRTFPGGTYLAAYEAGYAGFWIHDKLSDLGVNCIVIHAAGVPVKDKEKCDKTDPIDCRRIAGDYITANWTRFMFPLSLIVKTGHWFGGDRPSSKR